jgi:hypothetical protein
LEEGVIEHRADLVDAADSETSDEDLRDRVDRLPMLGRESEGVASSSFDDGVDVLGAGGLVPAGKVGELDRAKSLAPRVVLGACVGIRPTEDPGRGSATCEPEHDVGKVNIAETRRRR